MHCDDDIETQNDWPECYSNTAKVSGWNYKIEIIYLDRPCCGREEELHVSGLQNLGKWIMLIAQHETLY